ncbi:MAG: PH domain-containing protein [Bryobacteraceae bacterium]|nr:PH domain-containing protein [Bryobacteraceae bacterium]
MIERLRQLLLGVMRVPPEPAPPQGSPESVLTFRAGRNFYRWRLFSWGLKQIGAVIGIIWGLQFALGFLARLGPKTPWWLITGFQVVEAIGIAGFIMLIPVTLLQQRLDYELRWYIVTDRSLRIRHGLWNVEEMTMTFANVQQIKINQGPVQRMLGLADVEVTSAGGGAVSAEGHEKHDSHRAVFEGVDQAEAIRDLILERLKQYRDAGLGDPEDQQSGVQVLLSEARALRQQLA